MAHGMYILRDCEFEDPIFADPVVDEVDTDVWAAVVAAVHEALEHDGQKTGTVEVGEQWVSWNVIARSGLSFVLVMDESYPKADVRAYLGALSTHYLGEVDDVRFPESDGLDDVLIDVIAPWDE
jgi:hypothetical protein